MASSSRTIPHLLESYLRTDLPTETADLVLATGILGASTNWLVLRYLYSFLKHSSPTQHHQNTSSEISNDQEDQQQQITTSVLLVSFLRDHTFWKENAGRIGLDLDGYARTGRFGYVDGLSIDLFHSSSDGAAGGAGRNTPIIGGRIPTIPSAPQQPRVTPTVPGRHPPPSPGVLRGPPPGQGAIPIVGRRVPTTAPSTSTSGRVQSTESPSVLTNPSVAHIKQVVSDAVDKLLTRARMAGKKSRVVLVVDQLDFLLAAAGDDVSALALRELLLDLREMVDTTILTLSTDEPLINEQTTTLEKEHANFVLSLAHEAAMVLSLRLLDTGVAKDVSGVLRITAGGDRLHGTAIEENEYLYHVGGDGSVKVFERGQ